MVVVFVLLDIFDSADHIHARCVGNGIPIMKGVVCWYQTINGGVKCVGIVGKPA